MRKAIQTITESKEIVSLCIVGFNTQLMHPTTGEVEPVQDV